MKAKNIFGLKLALPFLLAGTIFAGIEFGAPLKGHAQQAPADLSPGLQQVVNLSKAGMTDDFIQTYITNSGRSYSLSVDDIIYLHQQGVSDGVIKTLMQPSSGANANSVPANASVAPSANGGGDAAGSIPPPPDAGSSASVAVTPPIPSGPPTLPYFQSQLAPYGTWVNVAGYGACWEPAVNPGWRPYYDGGHWVYTDSGWYWQSDYPWGDIPFHYGRWLYTTVGWVWLPGYDYSPAWVVWRHADDDGYIGWAPLPPGAVFVDNCWTFRGARVGFDFDFGLGATCFTFVDYGHLWVHDFRTCQVPRDRFLQVYQHSQPDNHFREDHGHFFNEGLDRDRVAQLSHHDIAPEREQVVRQSEQLHNANIRTRDSRAGHVQSGGFSSPSSQPNGREQNGGWEHNPGHNGNVSPVPVQPHQEAPRNDNNNNNYNRFHGGDNTPQSSSIGGLASANTGAWNRQPSGANNFQYPSGGNPPNSFHATTPGGNATAFQYPSGGNPANSFNVQNPQVTHNNNPQSSSLGGLASANTGAWNRQPSGANNFQYPSRGNPPNSFHATTPGGSANSFQYPSGGNPPNSFHVQNQPSAPNAIPMGQHGGNPSLNLRPPQTPAVSSPQHFQPSGVPAGGNHSAAPARPTNSSPSSQNSGHNGHNK